MTQPSNCQHEASKLSYRKMFINDNGYFGGQHVEILLECDCGDTIFINSYRGNMPQEYVKPNSILCQNDNHKDEIHTLKQQEVWT